MELAAPAGIALPARAAIPTYADALAGLPFGGGWTFEIASLPGGGAELRVTEDGEIYNAIFRFLARFLFGYTGSIETCLRDLGAKFGEPVAIEA